MNKIDEANNMDIMVQTIWDTMMFLYQIYNTSTTSNSLTTHEFCE